MAVALMIGATAFADEGMWMIQDINEALEKKGIREGDTVRLADFEFTYSK